MLQLSWGVGGIHIRQLGPFISARTAERHCTSSDCASAAPFEAEKAITQIAGPKINLIVDSDFIFIPSIFFMMWRPKSMHPGISR
jgi:hypothetical protein